MKMAPPRKQVTPDMALTVYHYFKDNWDRHDGFLKDADGAYLAKDALDGVRDLVADRKKQAGAMQAWMDEHATPEGVKRMWAAMRQKRYQRVNRPVLVALAPETHASLRDLSKRYKMTLPLLVDKLVREHRAELDRRDSERERENPADFDARMDGTQASVPASGHPAEKQGKVLTGGGSGPRESRGFKRQNPEKVEKIIMERIHGIPGAHNDELIWIPDLRNMVEKELGNKELFDNAILELAAQKKIIFHRHVHPIRMTEQERKAFITDGENWYVGFTLRREKLS